jgi:hypothetical protein
MTHMKVPVPFRNKDTNGFADQFVGEVTEHGPMRLLAKLMRPVWSMIILASGLSSKKPWNWASLPRCAFASASQPVRYLPRAGLSEVLRRPVVEIGVFLFMKAQLSNRLTTKTERFDKAQSGDGLFLYFLGKLGQDSKRAP